MPELYQDVSEVLFRHDPIGINFGENADEYDGEARRILDRFNRGMTHDQLLAIVHEVLFRASTVKLQGLVRSTPQSQRRSGA